MKNSFGHIASSYDDTFTHSLVGRAQRDRVWKLLGEEINTGKKLSVLEINCGTGHDAFWLAKQGHRVLATDSSPEMIETAKSKNSHHLIEYRVFDFTKPGDLPEKNFDLIFSNFGGLNCVGESELKHVLASAENCLAYGGKMIAVIMPDKCLWDQVKSLKHGKYNIRGKSPVEVNVEGMKVKCWYYSPEKMEQLGEPMKRLKLHPVGFFIPPSHFEKKMQRWWWFFRWLCLLEKKISHIRFLARYADHFYISLEKIK